MRRLRWALVVVALVAGSGSAAAPVAAAPTDGGNKVPVVAAEDVWGSIARQLGGERADVTSIIANPDTDPHDYEPKPSDGAAVARARVAIVNGIGYDGWMSKLLAANPAGGRQVVDVGAVTGVRDGGNPHQWYSPSSVQAVVDAVTDALKQADPAGAAYFDAQRQAYRTGGLKRYGDLLNEIENRYRGVPVGASESIFAPLAAELGLNLITPRSFLDAVSEGNEPTARDKATVDRQITSRQIKVFVYNAQNATPDVQALVGKARKAGVAVTTVTETLVPPGAAFQDWQVGQLEGLAAALAGTGGGQPGSSATGAPAPAPGRAHRSGTSGHWILWLAGAALVAGGLGLATAAGLRRRDAALQRA
jgi:zinc/manganese transport system substrate-binding protein